MAVINYSSYFPCFPPKMFPASSLRQCCRSHAPHSHTVSTAQEQGDVRCSKLFLPILPVAHCGCSRANDRLLFVLKFTSRNIPFTFWQSIIVLFHTFSGRRFEGHRFTVGGGVNNEKGSKSSFRERHTVTDRFTNFVSLFINVQVCL